MLQDITFIFDIDGTICPVKRSDQRYEDIVPFHSIVKKIREYKEQGARIVLFTSRNMYSYKGNLGLINVHTAKILLKWLDQWEIPYDEIVYGKPWPGHHGFYVDDRTIRPDEFIRCSTEELEQICKEGRIDN